MIRDFAIAYRYSSIALADLNYDSQAANQMKFKTLSCLPATVTGYKNTGLMLNGYRYEHTRYRHKSFNIIIGTDELYKGNPNGEAFLFNFWQAKYKYISIYESGQFSDYYEVVFEGEEFPLAYNEGLIQFPEISMRLLTVNPF